MKSITVICLLILFQTAFGTNGFAGDKLNVAVLDFSAKNVSQDDAAIINEFFRSELNKTGKFNLIDRKNISSVVEEQTIQTSGITDIEHAVKIGKLLNVQYIFVGSYSKLDTIFMLAINMINVQTGKIEKSESRMTENPAAKSRLDLARFIAYGFIGFGVGYELFWDGNRVGFEPEWSMDQAIKNLEWNRTAHPDKKVEGYYNGKKMNE